MPGLIRGVARTAVIAGTASAVGGRVNHRQQQKWAAQDQQAQAEQAPPEQAAPEQPQVVYVQAPPEAAPAPAAPAGGLDEAAIAQLKELAALKEQGILTDDEFAAQKAKILGS